MKIFLSAIFLSFSFLISAEEIQYDLVVSQDGTGNFITIQEAIDYVPHFRNNRTYIFIKNGTYKEKLLLAATKTNISFIGENVDSTIITYDDFASRKNMYGENLGTSGSAGFYVLGEGFEAENITFSNTAGNVGQAVAVRVDGDRISFRNCKFLGNQDTLYPHGEKSRQYYNKCFIEGTVDFIFGWSTAVFDSCTIHCIGKGYITAASTNEECTYGFVFRNCKVIGDGNATHYLGRPWRPHANVVFYECYLGDCIRTEGWHNWKDPKREKTAFFAEFNNTGPGSHTDKRVSWSHTLTEDEAKKYTLDAIFGDWKPQN